MTYRVHPSRPNLRANLKDGGLRPLWVVHTPGGEIHYTHAATFPAGARTVHGDPMADGTRVWIEAEAVLYDRVE